jgi:iron complex transport system ATP-binding protein
LELLNSDIRCEQLYFSRGEFRLKIDGLNIRCGEKIAVLGENGCGKTTLLQLMAGVLTPERGFVYINGNPRLNVEKKAEVISYLPQEAGLLFNLTVYELINLTYNEKTGLTGMGKTEMLEALELEMFMDREYHSLSGGEKRRAMLARALCRNTPFVLLDEPAAPLDLRHGWLAMTHISRASCAAVVAMHDINMALRYFDRFILMKNGEVAFDKGKNEINENILEEVYSVPMRRVDDFFVIAV